MSSTCNDVHKSVVPVTADRCAHVRHHIIVRCAWRVFLVYMYSMPISCIGKNTQWYYDLILGERVVMSSCRSRENGGARSKIMLESEKLSRDSILMVLLDRNSSLYSDMEQSDCCAIIDSFTLASRWLCSASSYVVGVDARVAIHQCPLV